MFNIFCLILGFILSVIGLFFIFLHLNLLVIGYSFWEFAYLIIRNIYTNIFFAGSILIILSLRRMKK
jgi:hypothetical protein